jgi:hypothetical protein
LEEVLLLDKEAVPGTPVCSCPKDAVVKLDEEMVSETE